jgi:hypothetical protein
MGTRTPDLLIANETLYQLSYTPNLIDFSELHGHLRSKKDACLYRHRPMRQRYRRRHQAAAPAIVFEVFRMFRA